MAFSRPRGGKPEPTGPGKDRVERTVTWRCPVALLWTGSELIDSVCGFSITVPVSQLNVTKALHNAGHDPREYG